MRHRLFKIILCLCLTRLEAKKPELPLCPTNMEYFPQNLPMHCRLPATIRPSSGKTMELIPALPAPGFPGPIPGPIPGMVPGAMPMPMAGIPQPPAQKLPVVVMPFYSPDTKSGHDFHKRYRFGFKRRPKHFYSSDEDTSSTDTDTSSDDSSDRSSEHGWWRRPRGGRRSNSHRSKRRRHQKNQKSKDLLTPVLQYVTKDGYVIFEKKISKGEAKNWLGNKKVDTSNQVQIKNEENINSKESKDDNTDTKFAMRDDENGEVKSDDKPPQVHQKKILKRKHPKKHVTE